ncbi:hypothetical protein JHK87_026518 [Glycine soja]|nr:hypothetical protein JHK87_026518 [Glycine soja]
MCSGGRENIYMVEIAKLSWKERKKPTCVSVQLQRALPLLFRIPILERKKTLVKEKRCKRRGRREEEAVRTLAWIPLRPLLSPLSLRPHGTNILSPFEKGTDSHSHSHSASHIANPCFSLFHPHHRFHFQQ